MAFVNELIPEEMMNGEFFSTLKMPSGRRFQFSSEHPRWVVDHERDTFLYHMEVAGRPPHECLGMYWKGGKIRIYGEMHTLRVAGKNLLAWRNVDVRIPDYIVGQRLEIFKAIEEAIIAYGFLGDNVGDVTLEFKKQTGAHS